MRYLKINFRCIYEKLKVTRSSNKLKRIEQTTNAQFYRVKSNSVDSRKQLAMFLTELVIMRKVLARYIPI